MNINPVAKCLEEIVIEVKRESCGCLQGLILEPDVNKLEKKSIIVVECLRGSNKTVWGFLIQLEHTVF